MGQDQLPLDDGGRRRGAHGAARAAVERTLTAWRAAGHLKGPASAAAARVLRDSADAVDAAAAAMRPGRCKVCGSPMPEWVKPGTPGSLAYANNIHAQLVAAATPTDEGGPDPYGGSADDDQLAAIVAAALRDGDDPSAAVDTPGLHAD